MGIGHTQGPAQGTAGQQDDKYPGAVGTYALVKGRYSRPQFSQYIGAVQGRDRNQVKDTQAGVPNCRIVKQPQMQRRHFRIFPRPRKEEGI